MCFHSVHTSPPLLKPLDNPVHLYSNPNRIVPLCAFLGGKTHSAPSSRPFSRISLAFNSSPLSLVRRNSCILLFVRDSKVFHIPYLAHHVGITPFFVPLHHALVAERCQLNLSTHDIVSLFALQQLFFSFFTRAGNDLLRHMMNLSI